MQTCCWLTTEVRWSLHEQNRRSSIVWPGILCLGKNMNRSLEIGAGVPRSEERPGWGRWAGGGERNGFLNKSDAWSRDVTEHAEPRGESWASCSAQTLAHASDQIILFCWKADKGSRSLQSESRESYWSLHERPHNNIIATNLFVIKMFSRFLFPLSLSPVMFSARQQQTHLLWLGVVFPFGFLLFFFFFFCWFTFIPSSSGARLGHGITVQDSWKHHFGQGRKRSPSRLLGYPPYSWTWGVYKELILLAHNSTSNAFSSLLRSCTFPLLLLICLWFLQDSLSGVSYVLLTQHIDMKDKRLQKSHAMFVCTEPTLY